MGLHLAVGSDERAYLVIGGEVAIAIEEIGTPVEPVERVTYLDSSWLRPDCPRREALFEEWLDYLWPTPELRVAAGAELDRLGGRVASRLAGFATPAVTGGAVAPRDPVPAPGAELPFSLRSGQGTVVYRWEPFPVSRRCRSGGTAIAADSFAAPELERACMPSGLAATGRLALPSPLPACFLYTLEPAAGSEMECGADTPLHGPSGGGVRLRFPRMTTTRAPIAAPQVLPVM